MAIDLNSDLGEGVCEDAGEHDATLLSIVSSANVACGGHAGDAESMARVCDLAIARSVAIGAHISYPDREGFGRRTTDHSAEQLTEQLLGQALELDSAALAAGSAVTYIKPHGALHHDCINNADDAQLVLDVATRFQEERGRSLALLCMPGALLLEEGARRGFITANEAFADRGYRADGRLVPRDAAGALITDPLEALTRLDRLLRDDEIVAIDGSSIVVQARSICVHGDTPGAVVMARRIKAAFDADRVRVEAFAPPPTRQVG